VTIEGGALQKNKTKAKLKDGETVFGAFVRYPDPGLIEFLGYQGWDFLVFDAEHGTVEPQDCENMTRAAELRGVTPIIRVTTNSQPVILRFLDTGVQGLLVPWVQSAAEAQAAVRSVKYQPLGVRGLAGARAADYGQTQTLTEYVEEANAETLVVLQIETAQAIDQLPEILQVKGIDVIFIGPSDLSQSLGLPGEFQNPIVQAAMQRIAETVARSEAALGLMVRNPESAREWQKKGAQYIAISIESVVGPAVKRYLQEAKV